MSRRTDQMNRIEASLGRIEGALVKIAGALNPDTPGGLSVVAADAKAARSSAEAAFAGVQALASVATAKPGPAELAAGLKSQLAAIEAGIRDLATATVAELRKERDEGEPRAPVSMPRPPVTPMTPVAKPGPGASARTPAGKGART